MNWSKLEKSVKEDHGMSWEWLAGKLGITVQSMKNKRENKTEFKLGEVRAICEILGLTSEERDEIFFSEEVKYNVTNEVIV